MMSNQEVPLGYKQTKVGVVPQEWEIVRLGDATDIKSGFAFKSKNLHDNKLKFQVLKMSNIYKNKLLLERSPSFIDTATVKELEFLLNSDDIVITLTGTMGKRDYGYSIQINQEKNILLNQRLARLREIENISESSYILYQLKNDRFLFQFFESTKGGTGNQANVGIKDLSLFLIPLPPLKEQQKIAEILTTWDDAISKLEKLTTSKEQLKKALMKKLLSGEVRFTKETPDGRFDGFSGEWEEVRLGDIGEFKTSSVNKIIDENEQIVNLVNYMDVYTHKHIDKNFQCSKTSIKKENITKVNLKKRDVLFTPSSETPDDIGHSSVILEDLKNVLHSYHVVRFRINIDMDLGFKGYVFNNERILKEFSKRATGSTRFTLSIKDFNDALAMIPAELKEQQKIAEVLSNADKEIDLLKNELEELKEQKKGLMQKLLTGEVRVKI